MCQKCDRFQAFLGASLIYLGERVAGSDEKEKWRREKSSFQYHATFYERTDSLYPGDYHKNEPSLTTEELLVILRKNKNHLGMSLSDANLLDRIKKSNFSLHESLH
jgi:hypothetical protein